MAPSSFLFCGRKKKEGPLPCQEKRGDSVGQETNYGKGPAWGLKGDMSVS